MDLSNDEVDYAILLSGPWGSGKTYFWNNHIRPIVEEMRMIPIYVSLYGITNTTEIDKKIFLERLPLLNSELKDKMNKSRIMEIGKVLVNAVFNSGIKAIGINKEEMNVDLVKLVDFSNVVLCFDDIERSKIEIGPLLGYINNFVEHDGIKTILIGNEEEIRRSYLDSNIEIKTLVAAYINKEHSCNR